MRTSRHTAPLLLATLLGATPLAGCGGRAVDAAAGAAPAPAAVADAGTEPETTDPLARPTAAPLVLVFAYSLSEELACSRSFESDGWSARYELLLEPTGAATLTVSSSRSHAFGPSAARFHPERDAETNRTQSGEERTWRGSFTWRGDGFAVALAPEEAACKTLVAGKGWYVADCGPAPAIAATCARGTVAALPEFGAAGAEATIAIEAFACAPAFGLPAPGEVDAALPAALPFAPAPGLELEYWRHGIGNLDAPKLRLAAPDRPVQVE